MSKCKECGNELAEGVKFCDECGAKVTLAQNKCPKCGCNLAVGVKFCHECGCKMQPKGHEEVSSDIDWDSPIVSSDCLKSLTDEQVELVACLLNRLTLSADINRVVMPDSEIFKKKIVKFKNAFSQRIEGADCGDAMLGFMEDPIGFVDFGDNGVGSRGTLFARKGIFYVSKTHPKLLDGSPVGGFVPWKVFYKFGKPRNEKTYCLVDWKEVISSNEVDDEFKANFDKDDEDLISKFFYINTGLSQSDVEEFMEELKSILSGDESESGDEIMEDDFDME